MQVPDGSRIRASGLRRRAAPGRCGRTARIRAPHLPDGQAFRECEDILARRIHRPYEGDTLVVDTIGLDERTFLDGFNTPHTKELHVIERLHLIDGGEVLEANVHVEDAGAFTMPWNAIQRFRRFEAAVAKIPVERLSVLATPAEGPLTEAVCAENPNSFFAGQPAMPIPQAATRDF
jgi:hypothetical protein